MSRYFVKIHLIDGTAFEGAWNDLSDDEAEIVRRRISGVLAEPNGELNVDDADGDWICCPARVVRYVQLIRENDEAA